LTDFSPPAIGKIPHGSSLYPLILVGWKSICQACNIKSVKTMRKKEKKYKMPILYMDGKPTIPANDPVKWWAKTKEY